MPGCHFFFVVGISVLRVSLPTQIDKRVDVSEMQLDGVAIAVQSNAVYYITVFIIGQADQT